MNDMNQNDAQTGQLTRALRRLKEGDEAMTTSPAVEARLLEEVRRLQKPQRRWSPQLIAALTAAAIVVATVSITWWAKSGNVPELVTVEATTEFFPLFYSSVPSAQTHLVRLELQRESLARFGLMSADGIERTTGTVLADVLIGDDGLARAVRFVQKRSQEQKQ